MINLTKRPKLEDFFLASWWETTSSGSMNQQRLQEMLSHLKIYIVAGLSKWTKGGAKPNLINLVIFSFLFNIKTLILIIDLNNDFYFQETSCFFTNWNYVKILSCCFLVKNEIMNIRSLFLSILKMISTSFQ